MIGTLNIFAPALFVRSPAVKTETNEWLAQALSAVAVLCPRNSTAANAIKT